MMKRFRYMLANLIAGGELARAIAYRERWEVRWEKSVAREEKRAADDFDAMKLIEAVRAERLYFFELASDRRDALQQIIACDTPNSNGTVKRMVRIAREGLE